MEDLITIPTPIDTVINYNYAWSISEPPSLPPPPPVASTSKRQLADETAAEGDQKRKRKQYASCDACRLRRVKCERPSEDEDCVGCVKRGFQCTKDYNQQRQTEVRAGKRLDTAVALFSKTTAPTSRQQSATPSQPASSSGSDYESALQHVVRSKQQERAQPFAYDSPEARLNDVQQNEFMANCLVTCYSDHIRGHNSIAFGDFGKFMERWEKAGRRLTALDARDQAIADGIVATAARVTDMPAVVGGGAPDLRRLVTNPTDADIRDLRIYGLQRDAVCRSIEAKAKSRAEQRLFTSSPTIEGIATLLMIQTLEDSYEPDTHASEIRMYSAAAIEQLRYIARKPNQSPEELEALNGMIMQSALICDAMWSFVTGRPVQISDEDLFLMRPSLLTCRASDLLAEASRMHKRNELAFINTFADHLVAMARRIRLELTSPMAVMRGGPTSIHFFRDVTNDLVVYLQVAELVEARMSSTFINLQDVRATRMGFTMQLSLVKHLCGETAKRITDPEQRALIDGYSSMMTKPFIAAIRRMADTAGELLRGGQLISAPLLWSPLQRLGSILMHVPCAEEGGPPSFSLIEKVRGLENIIAVIKHVAWSWPSYADPVDELEDQLEQLKSRFAPPPQLFALPIDDPSVPWWQPPIEQSPSFHPLDFLLPSS